MSNDDSSLKKLTVLLDGGNVAAFGCAESTLPRALFQKKEGRNRTFLKREARSNTSSPHGTKMMRYEQLSEIREEKSDVYFLDHEAVKVLFVDFPAAAQYVCVRLVPRLSWFIALPGLIRRLLIGLVKIKGIVTLETTASARRSWLVLEHLLTESLHTRLSLSSDIGVPGFIQFLKNAKADYVFLRFFEKLPELYREGGDLDILVSDEDERAVKGFLKQHPGSIGVDVWTVLRTSFNDITYYPPPLARKILKSAIDGPAGARIPAPTEAFLALAYHSVYHKGPFAGVPSSLEGIAVNSNPENDYVGVLERMASKLGINVDMTMESLDDYLHKAGWRPHLDTLAKIAPKNTWVWKQFFSVQPSEEIGLGFFVLKRKAATAGVTDSILQMISTHKDFEILHTKIFSETERQRVADTLRGGVWHGSTGPDTEYLPHMAVVVLDIQLARLSRLGVVNQGPKRGIKFLKKQIRKTFDTKEGNIVHATDNTHESLQYMEVCFPDEVQLIQSEVHERIETLAPSLAVRIDLFMTFFPRFCVYNFTKLKKHLRGALIDFLMKI